MTEPQPDVEDQEYHCPECGGKYPEPIEVRNKYGIESHHCPHCDAQLSDRFTKQKNVEECVHTATVDSGDEQVETCTECGAKMDMGHSVVGIKDVWNAQGGRL